MAKIRIRARSARPAKDPAITERARDRAALLRAKRSARALTRLAKDVRRASERAETDLMAALHAVAQDRGWKLVTAAAFATITNRLSRLEDPEVARAADAPSNPVSARGALV